MKRFNILFILLGLFLFVTPVYAQTEDRILEFQSNIVIQSNTQTDIEEKIIFQPSSYVERHGLEWTIPYVYSVSAFRRPTELNINKVQYYPLDNPTNITFNKYSREDENGWARLRIGDANILITQPYVYTINYTLRYTGVSYFDTHQEVFLNIIGPGWNCPIDNASATLTLPAEISEAVCYTGPDGSREQNCTTEISGNTLTVKPNSTLYPYQGYTIAIKQPLGTFEDTRKEQAKDILLANSGILLPIPVGIILFVFLKKIQKGKQYTVVPQYEPPAGIDALSASILIKDNEMFNPKYISALLIEMAIKGYYKIKELKKRKYEIVKIKEYQAESEHTKYILNSIFVYGDTVPLTKLVNFQTTSLEAYKQAIKLLQSNGYISNAKKTIKNVLKFFSSLFLILLFISISFFIALSAIGSFIGFVISLILINIYVRNINIKSDIGNQMASNLMGLKMYIKTAEKERIEFHNDPKKYREVFEKLLPYAMIFELEKKWAEQFKDIYITNPEWYEGNFNSFNTVVLTNSLSSFNRSVITSTAPQSNYSSFGGFRSSGWSSGGSGFGGGGSSGGGGGGSGGGGW